MKTIDAEKFLSALEEMKQHVMNNDSNNPFVATANTTFKVTLDSVAAAARMAMVEDTKK